MASCSLVLFVTKGSLCMHTSWGDSGIPMSMRASLTEGFTGIRESCIRDRRTVILQGITEPRETYAIELMGCSVRFP